METRIIAFGDIHGHYKAALKAVQLAEENQAQAIFLGDYVDRGPSALETLRILIEAKQNHPEWIFLRGNHDQMLLDLITGQASINDIGEAISGNFDYAQTAKSYEEWQQTNNDEKTDVFDFLNNLEYYYETKKNIFCHAVINQLGGNMYEKSKELLIWNYDYEPKWLGKIFVHGHLLVTNPSFFYHGININTKCGYGGYLTGLVLNNTNDLEFYTISETGHRINNFKVSYSQDIAPHTNLIVFLEDSGEELEIFPSDISSELDWIEANEVCMQLGGGWRLPTVNEMDEIYKKCLLQDKGVFNAGEYWCIDEDDEKQALFSAFYGGGGYSMHNKEEKLNVRPVRILK